MNWFKKSQKNITINDIIKAIDNIILKDNLITVEGLLDTRQKLGIDQQQISKAAQVVTDRLQGRNIPQETYELPSKQVIDLVNKGYKNKDISKITGFPEKEIKKIVKKMYPKLKDKTRYFQENLNPKIIDTTQSIHQRTMDDLTIGKISYKRISEEMGGVSIKHIKEVLKKNNIEINSLVRERQNLIEIKVVKIVEKNSTIFNNVAQIQKVFKERHGLLIPTSSLNRILKYRNIITSRTNTSEALIYSAFKQFLNNSAISLKTVNNISPFKLGKIIDKFIIRVGENYGFESPMDKEKLKKMLMTKIQLRDRVLEQGKERQWLKNFSFYNSNKKNIKNLIDQGADIETLIREYPQIPPAQIKQFYHTYQLQYMPFTFDEDQLSYFLENQASTSINWFKKANKWKDKIPGGLADKKKPSDYNKTQLNKGQDIEFEHTNDPAKAKEIAMDHLEEHPEYYKELDKMEKKLEKEKKQKMKETKPATNRRGKYRGGQQRIKPIY
jgi:hypothetical protein